MDNIEELISKAEVKELFRPKNSQDFSASVRYNEICRSLDKMKVYNLPESSEHSEREAPREGTWQSTGHLGDDYKCSECEGTSELITDYCPHCGAKMTKRKVQRRNSRK